MASAILTLPEGPPEDCFLACRLKIARGDVSLGLRGFSPPKLLKNRRSARRRMAKLEDRLQDNGAPFPRAREKNRDANSECYFAFLSSFFWLSAAFFAAIWSSSSSLNRTLTIYGL